MSSVLGTLKAFITADNSSLLAGARDSATAMQRMSTNIAASLNKTGTAVAGFGKSLTIGLTLPIAAAGIGILKLASDAEEAGSKFNTVFKDVEGQATSAANELSKSFGLSGLASKKLLGDTGDLLTGFGFTGQEALDLSTEVNKLAVDLASFTNVEGGAEQASAALTKALLGERESAKELGIAILEVDVKQKVAQMRAKGMTFATERQAKAYATLAIATEQSKNAIGDFARTQDSVANRSRVLKARLTDVAVSLGTMLLPMANKIIGKLLELVTAFQELDPQIKANIIVVAGLAAALGPALFIFGKLLTMSSFLFTAFSSIAGVFKLIISRSAVALVFTKVGAALAFMISPIGLLIIAFVGVAAILVKTGKAAETVGKVWVGLRTTLSLVLSGIGTLLGGTLGFISDFLVGIQVMADAVGIDMPESLTKFTGVIDNTERRLKAFAEVQAENAADMSMNWDTAWETFQTDMEGALNFAETFGREKLEAVKGMVEELTGKLGLIQSGEGEGEGDGFIGPPESGPGSSQEQENLDKSATAWTKWADTQNAVAKNWDGMWAKTSVSVANGFASGFADMIVSGRSFNSVITGLASTVAKELIAQAIKSAIARVAVAETVTVANSAAAAPHPFAIPLFVGIGLAAFASAIGGSSGGSKVGGGGGGGGAGGGGVSEHAIGAIPQTVPLATTSFAGPEEESDEEGEGGISTREQEMSTAKGKQQAIVIELDGEVLASAIVKQTKNGMGDGADTLALAT